MALTQAQINQDAAIQAGFPNLASSPGLLAAIENQESGGNVNAQSGSSSASGPFQFLTGTAAQYGLTTGPGGTVYDQTASATAAAQYLSDLETKTGSIEGAVSGYSGGSYTYNQLAASQSDYLGNGLSGGVTGGGLGTSGTPAQVAGSPGTGSWGDFITEIAKRAGVVVIGVGIILIALFWLFGEAAIHEWKAAGRPIPI